MGKREFSSELASFAPPFFVGFASFDLGFVCLVRCSDCAVDLINESFIFWWIFGFILDSWHGLIGQLFNLPYIESPICPNFVAMALFSFLGKEVQFFLWDYGPAPFFHLGSTSRRWESKSSDRIYIRYCFLGHTSKYHWNTRTQLMSVTCFPVNNR